MFQPLAWRAFQQQPHVKTGISCHFHILCYYCATKYKTLAPKTSYTKDLLFQESIRLLRMTGFYYTVLLNFKWSHPYVISSFLTASLLASFIVNASFYLLHMISTHLVSRARSSYDFAWKNWLKKPWEVDLPAFRNVFVIIRIRTWVVFLSCNTIAWYEMRTAKTRWLQLQTLVMLTSAFPVIWFLILTWFVLNSGPWRWLFHCSKFLSVHKTSETHNWPDMHQYIDWAEFAIMSLNGLY